MVDARPGDGLFSGALLADPVVHGTRAGTVTVPRAAPIPVPVRPEAVKAVPTPVTLGVPFATAKDEGVVAATAIPVADTVVRPSLAAAPRPDTGPVIVAETAPMAVERDTKAEDAKEMVDTVAVPSPLHAGRRRAGLDVRPAPRRGLLASTAPKTAVQAEGLASGPLLPERETPPEAEGQAGVPRRPLVALGVERGKRGRDVPATSTLTRPIPLTAPVPPPNTADAPDAVGVVGVGLGTRPAPAVGRPVTVPRLALVVDATVPNRLPLEEIRHILGAGTPVAGVGPPQTLVDARVAGQTTF